MMSTLMLRTLSDRGSLRSLLRHLLGAGVSTMGLVLGFSSPAHADMPDPARAQQALDDAQAPPEDGDDFADADPSALTDFREPLAPYGQWTEDPDYGTLWVPDAAQVGPDFAPYQTAGQWAMNDTNDWMWQSDYGWGYIPFHYGRWVWAGSSWGWIPGRRYAPAWVNWRVGEGGYVGWAPRPPAYGWHRGRATRIDRPPPAAYGFVPTNYAFMHGVSAYVVRDRAMIGGIAATTHAYQPATPTVGRSNGGVERMSPTLSQAHIPSSASPARASANDARAMAYATRSATSSMRRGYAPNRASNGVATYRIHGNGEGSGVTYAHPTRVVSPGIRTPGGNAPSYSTAHTHAGYPAGPHYAAPAPAYHPPQQPAAAPHPARSVRSGGGRRR